jgi:hypothetical protein
MAIATTTALVGAALGIGAGASILGAREQRKAQDRASDVAERAEAERLGISRELLAEGRPLREALVQSGLSALPGLTEFADITQAGTGPQFEIPLQRGTEALFRNLAPFGLTDSSVAARGVGELTSGFLGQDVQRRIGVGQSLLGLAPTSTAGGINVLGQAGQLAGQQAQIAGQSPTAGLFGDIAQVGSTIGSLGLLKQLGFGTFGGGGSTTGTNLGVDPTRFSLT